ncbi:MAG: aspartate-semialdehyde dehydrogenase [Phycisphaerales bacterium]|nr:MAG: aspartate-semialdehyde dehydrogenase [Phycisphaerales bacterium]
MIEHLAILGATGAVGREACGLVEERGLRFGRLSLLGSARTAGARITVAGETIEVAEAGKSGFDGVTHAIFSAGAERSQRFAPIALGAGAVIVDNSSAFRMDAGVPLVIPEINPDDLRHHEGIIANPNCSALIMDVVTWPLHRVNRLRRIVVSTYQAASGAGAAAMQELVDQSRAVLRGERPVPNVFPHPIAFNLFSHDSSIGPDGYNAEERKIIQETRKIFHEPDLAISATCIRVPVRRAHSESINLTFERPITPEEAREILAAAPGIRVVDDAESNRFPMPLEAEGRDEVLVGRIRQDASQPDGRGLGLFACGDQLRKGAALNAIQILELLAEAESE